MSDKHPEVCTCGAELYVIRGGFLACLSHCDGPDCCRSNESKGCKRCKAYADARPTWAGS